MATSRDHSKAIHCLLAHRASILRIVGVASGANERNTPALSGISSADGTGARQGDLLRKPGDLRSHWIQPGYERPFTQLWCWGLGSAAAVLAVPENPDVVVESEVPAPDGGPDVVDELPC